MYTKFTLLLLLLCAGFSLQAQTDKVFEEVDQMPRWRTDCPDGQDAKLCSDQAMLSYVYEEIQYPAEATKNEAEGMVVISFIVEKDGSISSPEIYRDQVGHGAGEEVLRIVRQMNANGPSWRPGLREGTPVRTEFKLPVKFKLS